MNENYIPKRENDEEDVEWAMDDEEKERVVEIEERNSDTSNEDKVQNDESEQSEEESSKEEQLENKKK